MFWQNVSYVEASAHLPKAPIGFFTYCSTSIRLSVRLSSYISVAPTAQISAKIDIGQDFYTLTSRKSKFVSNWTFCMKYVSLLPSISNRHKSDLFERNGIRLLEQMRRYTCYGNAPRCYVTCTRPTLLSLKPGSTQSNHQTTCFL